MESAERLVENLAATHALHTHHDPGRQIVLDRSASHFTIRMMQGGEVRPNSKSVFASSVRIARVRAGEGRYDVIRKGAAFSTRDPRLDELRPNEKIVFQANAFSRMALQIRLPRQCRLAADPAAQV